MTNVLIIGAGGSIASKVIDILSDKENIHLTLFLRNASRLRKRRGSNSSVIEGDALNIQDLETAMNGIDIVYVNLAGDLETMAKNIVKAMKDKGVKRIVFISSIGIYDTPLQPVLIPYRGAADIIEKSGLDYTILRPQWYSDADEVDYELTKKGEPEKGSVISRKSLAALLAKIVENPEMYSRENLSINKPNS
jgi:uncharacterized protein YbjT (DUF2867 family)